MFFGNLNKATIIGRLTKAPDLRTVTGGTTAAALTVSTVERWFDGQNQLHEKTDLHRIILRDDLAVAASRHLVVSSRIQASGPLQTRSFIPQGQTQKRYVSEIIAQQLSLIPELTGNEGLDSSAMELLGLRDENKIVIIGRLGQDPEIRAINETTNVAAFSVASTEQIKNQQGEFQDVSEWHKIVAYRHLSDAASRFLKKGSKVYIEGRIQTREWLTQQGQKVYTTEIIASDFQPLDSQFANNQTR